VIKAEFIIITPVFSVTWSFTNHSKYDDLMINTQLWLLSVLKTTVYIFVT